MIFTLASWPWPVSYTHLDVYKRQKVEKVEIFKADGIYRYIYQNDMLIADVEAGEHENYFMEMCIRDRCTPPHGENTSCSRTVVLKKAGRNAPWPWVSPRMERLEPITAMKS